MQVWNHSSVSDPVSTIPVFFFKSMITHDKGERTYLPPIAKLNILQTGLIASLIKGSSWLLSASGCKMAVPV
jgi:hypothetical protein